MTAGMPGTGIGGVFYLASALVMPFIELLRTLRGRSSKERWRLVLRQLAMSALITAGMWLIGLLLGVIVEFFNAGVNERLAHILHVEQSSGLLHLNVFHVAPMIVSLTTLTLIICATLVMRLVFARGAASAS
jgi:hypothetical protein